MVMVRFDHGSEVQAQHVMWDKKPLWDKVLKKTCVKVRQDGKVYLGYLERTHSQLATHARRLAWLCVTGCCGEHTAMRTNGYAYCSRSLPHRWVHGMSVSVPR